MDRNDCCEIEVIAARLRWQKKKEDIGDTKLCKWVSAFHPEKLSCTTDSVDRSGSFNKVFKMTFQNTNEAWAVRFPLTLEYDPTLDERVEAEVTTINMVREQTDIPVPEIKAWGLARDNDLGLGPFIISAWAEGIELYEFVKIDDLGKRFRDDIPAASIEHLWRQIARFMLQLSRINFDYIGSCTTKSQPPLTFKAHHMLSAGGVQLSCSPSTTFTSSLDFFSHVADHDLHQLHEQLNSVDDAEDARQKYINWTVLKKLVPRFVDAEHGPFKLICDDFGPTNMLINNMDDLEIVAVIDWEFCYAGPKEFFWSPPTWLLGQHPTQWDSEAAALYLPRYLNNLETFIRVVQEEEFGILGNCAPGAAPSELLRRHQQDGSMWFYMIMNEAFNGHDSVLFRGLRASVPDFEELAAAVPVEETEKFVQKKLEHLKRYKNEVAEAGRREPFAFEIFSYMNASDEEKQAWFANKKGAASDSCRHDSPVDSSES